MPELRRMRPLLGTFVEVAVDADTAAGHAAIDACFGAVEKVQSLMSIHDQASELSRLNRDAQRMPVKVHPWTWRVLQACRRLHEASGGLFDPSAIRRTDEEATTLHDASVRASFNDVALNDGYVSFRRPLRLDFGGVAKGFAVDRGIAALRAMGIRQAHVNAGGDLRAMGPAPIAVSLRDPSMPARTMQAGMLHNAACATSGGYFNDDAGLSAIVSPRTGKPTRIDSITVIARSCMMADALTKVVALTGLPAAEALLVSFNATAYTGLPQ